MFFIASPGAPHFGSWTFWAGTGALWIGSAAVSAMAPPEQESSSRYRYLYRLMHLLAANLDRAGVLPSKAGLRQQ